MNTLIVYYSLEGNTEMVAERIAALLPADTLRLEPVKAYPTGKVSKFVWGGKSAMMAETPKLKPYSFHPDAYDRIIFGFPVWASNIVPPLRTFIRDNDVHGKRIAVFACQTAAGADKAYIKLKEELGIDTFEAELTLLDPKLKPDDGNEQKIKDFCAKLN